MLILIILSTLATKLIAETKGPVAKSDVVVQISRYFESGGSEEYYLHCPPNAKKTTHCDNAKLVNEVEVQQSEVNYRKAFSVVEHFLGDLPSGDVVGPEEPPALQKSGETAILWQARLGKRWSKGTIHRAELLKPTDLNVKRLQALHGAQWRLMGN